MSYVTSFAKGVVAANMQHHIITDRRTSYAGATPVIYCHHATGTALTSFPPVAEAGAATDQSISRIARRLATLGHPFGASDQVGPTSWSVDAAQTEVGALLTQLGSKTGCRTDRVLLLGDSMGSNLALNWARNNATKVAALALLLPIPSLAYAHTDPGGNVLSSAIDAAYGSTAAYNAAQPTHDPALFPASYKDMHLHFWAADDDVVGSRAQVDAFIAAVRGTGGAGSTAVDSLGNVGHTIPTTFNINAVCDFLHAHI